VRIIAEVHRWKEIARRFSLRAVMAKTVETVLKVENHKQSNGLQRAIRPSWDKLSFEDHSSVRARCEAGEENLIFGEIVGWPVFLNRLLQLFSRAAASSERWGIKPNVADCVNSDPGG
jgi:hypothetical protein